MEILQNLITKDLKSNYLIFLLIIFYVFVYFIGETYGYKVGSDSQRYIRYSNNLNELFTNLKAFCSSSYVLIIFLIKEIGISINSIYFIQFFVHSIAACFIYLYFHYKNFDTIISILISASYLFYPPLLFWDFYLLTDSLNVHLSIISLFLLVFSKKKYTPLVLILIIFSSLIRAHSIFLLFTCIIYIFYFTFRFHEKKYFYLILTILLLKFIFILNYLSIWIINYISISYVSGKFIWGNDTFGINGINLKVEIINLFDLLKVMISNPIYTIEYMFKKFFLYVFGVRPGYSFLHNLFLYITILLMLIPTIYEISYRIYKKLWNDYFFNFLLIYICFNLSASLVCFLDPDARFVLPLYPFMIICSGYFINRIYVYYKKNFINF